jgi:hypothetical protein
MLENSDSAMNHVGRRAWREHVREMRQMPGKARNRYSLLFVTPELDLEPSATDEDQ